MQRSGRERGRGRGVGVGAWWWSVVVDSLVDQRRGARWSRLALCLSIHNAITCTPQPFIY